MRRSENSKASVPSVSDPRLSRTGAGSSVANDSPEVMTIHSVPNRTIGFSSTLPSLTNLSVVVSGTAEGVGIVPPPIAAVRCSGESQLSDRVQHSLKRSIESEELPGLLNKNFASGFFCFVGACGARCSSA